LPLLFVASQCRCCPLLSVPELRRLCQCQRYPSIAVSGKSMPVPSESNPSPCSRCRRCAMFCSGDAMQRQSLALYCVHCQSKAVPSQCCASPSPVSSSRGAALPNFATACRIHSTPMHVEDERLRAIAPPCFAFHALLCLCLRSAAHCFACATLRVSEPSLRPPCPRLPSPLLR
jgi:hypothetical protein